MTLLPMHYALDFRTFIYSHYFHSGLRIATGIMLSTGIIAYFFAQEIAMTAFLGALCTSSMDLQSPLRHKFNEMLAGLILCTCTTFAITISAPIPILMGFVVVLICFFMSMMLVYGKKIISLQLTALLVMATSMRNDFPISQIYEHTAVFFIGGLIYLLFSMLVCYLQQYRFKQQILSEALFELSRYLRLRAGFYDLKNDLTQQFNLLVQQQIVIADKQQEARDLLLRSIHAEHDGRLLQIHLRMLDFYEQIMSTNADYEAIRLHFKDSDILIFIRDIALKIAEDVEEIAFSISSNTPSPPHINYQAELRAIEFELIQLQQDNHTSEEVVDILHATYFKVKEMIEYVKKIRAAIDLPVNTKSFLTATNVTPFLTQQKYKFHLLKSHLNWQSPFFRYAVRLSLAVLVGILIGLHLPYMSRPHWIAITIIIILKPNFSLTRQRLHDRFVGTIIGSMIAFAILLLFDDLYIRFFVLFLASVAAPAFASLRYKYTVIAATIQVIILVSLFIPEPEKWLIAERTIDTAIGIIIAFAFSYLLPSWEYLSTKNLLANVLQSNQQYLDASRQLLESQTADDFFYRVCRKDFMNHLSALIDMIIRMSNEPKDKQHVLKELNQFVIHNYLIASHIAAIRILLQRYQRNMPRLDLIDLIDKTLIEAHYKVEDIQTILGTCISTAKEKREATKEPPEFVLESETPEVTYWSSWNSLRKRTESLLINLNEIQKQTQAISHHLTHRSVS